VGQARQIHADPYLGRTFITTRLNDCSWLVVVRDGVTSPVLRMTAATYSTATSFDQLFLVIACTNLSGLKPPGNTLPFTITYGTPRLVAILSKASAQSRLVSITHS
jgi:hypothetical protein